MWNQLTTIRMNGDGGLQDILQWGGQQYRIVQKGLFFKHQCLINENKEEWLKIKRKGKKDFQLLFASGHKYHLEVLTYSLTALVFYDKEDTEIFRLTQQAFSPDAICLLISEVSIPEEEFFAMAAWGFYFFRWYTVNKNCSPAA